MEIRNRIQKFKEDFSKAKNKPTSKRKSLLLGFTAVLSIFGVTLLTSVLPAIAENVPKPGQVCLVPTPTPPPLLMPSQQIVNTLSGIRALICALAVTSGSFVIGGVCGLVVAIGILKA
jgi:hypothetical protein